VRRLLLVMVATAPDPADVPLLLQTIADLTGSA
jgi:hypothetical protein